MKKENIYNYDKYEIQMEEYKQTCRINSNTIAIIQNETNNSTTV